MCLLKDGPVFSPGRADFKLISSWAYSHGLQRTTSLPLPPHPPTQGHLIAIALMWAVTVLITFRFCPFLPQMTRFLSS